MLHIVIPLTNLSLGGKHCKSGKSQGIVREHKLGPHLQSGTNHDMTYDVESDVKHKENKQKSF